MEAGETSPDSGNSQSEAEARREQQGAAVNHCCLLWKGMREQVCQASHLPMEHMVSNWSLAALQSHTELTHSLSEAWAHHLDGKVGE